MLWSLSWRADPRAKALADQHYNRQNKDSAQFVPPGRCLVLYRETSLGRAFWVSSYPFAEHVKHACAGAFVCSAFRNEGAGLSSDMIREAVAATRWRWPDVPSLGMVTFVDPAQTTAGRGRFSRPGKCYVEAGFQAPKCRPCHGLGSRTEARRSEDRRRARRGVRRPADCPACFGTGDAHTAGGLPAFQMVPGRMPPPRHPSACRAIFSGGWRDAPDQARDGRRPPARRPGRSDRRAGRSVHREEGFLMMSERDANLFLSVIDRATEALDRAAGDLLAGRRGDMDGAAQALDEVRDAAVRFLAAGTASPTEALGAAAIRDHAQEHAEALRGRPRPTAGAVRRWYSFWQGTAVGARDAWRSQRDPAGPVTDGDRWPPSPPSEAAKVSDAMLDATLAAARGARERMLIQLVVGGWLPEDLCTLRLDQVQPYVGTLLRLVDDEPSPSGMTHYTVLDETKSETMRVWLALRVVTAAGTPFLFPGLTPERVAETLRDVAHRAGVPEVTLDAIRVRRDAEIEAMAERIFYSSPRVHAHLATQAARRGKDRPS